MLFDQEKEFLISDKYRNYDEIMSIFSAITVSADGLAPVGARPSADTIMTKFSFYIHIGPAFECLNCIHCIL